jgi:alkylation response protein AidB-like acyl-CoA dehydrogenase
VEIASALFELTGTASTDEGHGLDRHWRNARTHTLHDPARWRYHHVGRSILDATAATADAGARDASTSVTPLDETERADRINSAEGAVRIAAAFAKQFAPGASARDSSGGFPGDELRAIARSGLLAITVPTEFGGIGAGVETVVEVARLLSEADPSIGQLTLPQFVLFRVILELGSEDQKRRFFDRVLDGKRFGNATQPSKRPGARLETTIARRIDPLTIRLDGEKYYTTGSVNADYIVVAATDEDGEAVSVVVAGDAPGLDVVEDDWDSFGQRSTVSGTVRLNGVLASADDVLYSRALFGVPNLLLAIDQIQHGAVDVGIARAALADAAWFVQERANPARESGLDRAAEDPHTIYRFGQLRTQLDAAEALLRQSARIIDAIDASGDRSVEAIDAATVAGNQLKAFAAEVGSEIASAVFELTGTSSTDKRYGLDRHWRNVRTHSINVATRWRYDQIGKSTLATFPASSATRVRIIADEAGEVTV